MDIRKETGPLFSVIVPIYNNEKEMGKCIDSILAQTFSDFELILVDDGSTDTTPYICECYKRQDARVRVVHKQNEGVAAARNDGLFLASGRYVYYVDADDWIDHLLLEKASRVLTGPDSPDLFVFGICMITEEGKIVAYPCFGELGLYQKERLEREIYPKMMRKRDKKTWMSVVSPYLCDKIILRELCSQHYCRDTALFMGEESVCAYECMYYAEKVYFSPDIMYYYNRLSESSMHWKYHADLFENSIRLAQYYRTYLGKGKQELERQINIKECRNLKYVIEHEVKLGSSVYHSAVCLDKKIKQMRKIPICPLDGLSLFDKGFILMLSFRLHFFLLLTKKIVVWIVYFWNKVKSGKIS